jgi:sporulation protein YlmC with PRC-barrel domain
MQNKQSKLTMALIAVCFALAVPYGQADDQGTRRSAHDQFKANAQCKASEIIGKEVKNTQDESLGKIQDLIVNTESGKVPYAIIAHGGALGVGRTKTAVPMSSLECSSDGKAFVLSATKEQLRAASKTPPEGWIAATGAEWTRSVDGFYGQPTATRERAERFEREYPADATEKRLFVRDPAQKGAELLMNPADSALCGKVCDVIENVQVSVHNSVVTIYGTVESDAARQDIENRVRSVSGVSRVENNLKVKKQ